MDKKKKLWKHPFGYKEGFIISLLVLLVGFFVEIITGKAVALPVWPVNIIILLVFIGYIVLVQKFIKIPIVRWLSSPTAAISSISVFTILVLLMGFIPQHAENSNRLVDTLGLNHMTSSWGYFLVSVYLMLILGLTTVRRLFPLSIKNFAFFLNHGGLWIVIATASLGSSDLWRLSMPIQEGEVTFTVYDKQSKPYQLPFAVKLMDFDIEVYKPRIGIMKNSDGRLDIKKGDKLFEVEEGADGIINDWEVHVPRYIDNAVFTKGGYRESDELGAAPAALLVVIDPSKKDTIYGWVCCGSFAVKNRFLPLNESYSLAMIDPTAKVYSSVVRLYNDMQDYEEVTIEVNKPVSFKGWKIYQVGYDEQMGKWSNLSILELVKDPWLPVVYTGIFMILIGSLYLVWMGRSTKFKKQ